MSANKKVVIITGASSGIGLWAAVKFASEGWITYAALRNPSKTDELFETAASKKAKDNLRIVELDQTKEESVKKAIDQVIAKEGHIDVVVNNAGAGYFGAIESFSDSDVLAQYDLNVFGVLRVIRAILPHFRARKSGRIVNISSVLGTIANPYNTLYASTKFALEGLSQGLHDEVAPFGIKVVLVEPGFTKTKFGNALTYGSLKADAYSQAIAGTLTYIQEKLKTATEPAVVADTIFEASTVANPTFRYQATADDAALVAGILKDPRGLNKPTGH